jgi:hypothetical protein
MVMMTIFDERRQYESQQIRKMAGSAMVYHPGI